MKDIPKHSSKITFANKFLSRLDKIDSKKVKEYVEQLLDDNLFFIQTLDELMEGVILLNQNSEIIFLNKSAKNFLMAKGENWLGKKAPDLFKAMGIPNPVKDIFEHKNLSLTHQVQGLTPDDSILSVRVVPFLKENIVGGVMVFMQDLTSYLQDVRDNIQNSKLDSIRLLSASIAHEIGNPLNSIEIYLQLIKRELAALPSDSVQSIQESIEIVHSEVRRIHQIMQDFLAAVRPLNVDYRGIDINELLKEVLQPFKQIMTSKGIHLKLIFQSNLPKVQLDSKQISQAIGNLIKNAVEAMGSSGNLIVKTELKHKMLVISLEDDGCGIPPELMGRIFEPYVTTKKSGSGLGLMVVQRIIKDHRGRIEVQSKEKHGTKILISLPVEYRSNVKLISTHKDDKEK